MLFHRPEEIIEGDFRRGYVLVWIIERMNMPTNKSIVSTKDPCSVFNESIREIPSICIVKDINESSVSQKDPDLDHRVI